MFDVAGLRVFALLFVGMAFALGQNSSRLATVTLAWDASPVEEVVGYRVYYGVESMSFTNSLEVGNVVEATVSNLMPGITYFFAATALDSSGLESDFSNETSFTPPPTEWSLAVDSISGGNAVPVMVSPSDNNGLASGQAPFTRTYIPKTILKLTVPATTRSAVFEKWTRNGADWAATPSTTIVMDAAHALTAVYQTATPLAAALDMPGGNWIAGGNGSDWLGQTLVTHDGVAAARSVAVGNRQSAWMETTVRGPGTVVFLWKVSSEANYDVLSFAVDGVRQAQISGEKDWEEFSFQVEAGSHTLRWTYAKDGSVSGGEDAAWVDRVKFTALNPEWPLSVSATNVDAPISIMVTPADNNALASAEAPFTRSYNDGSVVRITAAPTAPGAIFEKWQKDGVDWTTSTTATVAMDGAHSLTAIYQKTIPLAEALDTPDASWVTAGHGSGWLGQAVVTHDGVAAARSGALANSQAVWMETTLTGPGTLAFWWKVSSERGYDYLSFAIDGLKQAQISGETDWVQVTLPLESGSHNLRWTYDKDHSVSSGMDAAWVDQVSFIVPTVGKLSVRRGQNGTTVPQTEASPPQLHLSLAADNAEMRLSWPISAAGWVVEQATSLNGGPLDWLPVKLENVRTNDRDSSIVLPAPSTSRLYRLRKP